MAFRAIDSKAITREFVSPFLTTAVMYLREKLPSIILNAERVLKGSHGFGLIDYSIDSDDGTLAIVIEVENEEFERGVAQACAQMHSVVEVWKFFFFDLSFYIYIYSLLEILFFRN